MKWIGAEVRASAARAQLGLRRAITIIQRTTPILFLVMNLLNISRVTLAVVAAVAPLAAGGPPAADEAALFRNPFNGKSAHHRPIGTGAIYSADGSAEMAALHRYGFGNVNPGLTVIESKPTDSMKTVIYKDTTRSHCCPDQFPVKLRYPDGLGTTNFDAVLIVFDPTSPGTLHEFYHWAVDHDQASAANHHSPDIRGLGHPRAVGRDRQGTSATGATTLFGLMRGEEVNTPGCRIEHVAQFTLPNEDTIFNNRAVWPAGFIDGFARNHHGPIPYGALLALPPENKGGPNLDQLGLSEPGRRVAEQLRDYGGYAVDSTRAKVTHMRADHLVRSEVRAQLTADMKKIYPHLRMVTNNEENQTASGGGTPLARNSAFDADPTVGQKR